MCEYNMYNIYMHRECYDVFPRAPWVVIERSRKNHGATIIIAIGCYRTKQEESRCDYNYCYHSRKRDRNAHKN
jgi:hypothetical protein